MRTHEIRADYDATSIAVYQAYRPEIARAAVDAGRFVPPFSRGRMTWVKPSFLWMMQRSGWASKPGQEMVLRIRISRTGWEHALGCAALSHPDPRVYRDEAHWGQALKEAPVRIQWDPERTLSGGVLDARSIQVGLSRHIVDHYVDEWILGIEDVTPLAHKIHRLVLDGETTKAKRLLPREHAYPLTPELAHRIGAGS
jgi:hypothetical protein